MWVTDPNANQGCAEAGVKPQHERQRPVRPPVEPLKRATEEAEAEADREHFTKGQESEVEVVSDMVTKL